MAASMGQNLWIDFVQVPAEGRWTSNTSIQKSVAHVIWEGRNIFSRFGKSSQQKIPMVPNFKV